MPAQTFHIIAPEWIPIETLAKNISEVCNHIDFQHERTSHKSLRITYSNNNESYLELDLYDQTDVDKYFDDYPVARKEPIERVFHYVFIEGFKNMYYRIADANHYMDRNLCGRFSKEYLSRFPDHLISLDGATCIDSEQIKKVFNVEKGWIHQNKDLHTVTNFNV